MWNWLVWHSFDLQLHRMAKVIQDHSFQLALDVAREYNMQFSFVSVIIVQPYSESI